MNYVDGGVGFLGGEGKEKSSVLNMFPYDISEISSGETEWTRLVSQRSFTPGVEMHI